MFKAPRRPPRPEWLRWLVAVNKEGHPGRLRGFDFGALTGQDMRALGAIAACWELLSNSDGNGARGALAAVRAILPALQPQCHVLARELIARAMDWGHRDQYWPKVQPGAESEGPKTPRLPPLGGRIPLALMEDRTREQRAADGDLQQCRVCGCTDDDCSGCVAQTGAPCSWVERDLCSACVNAGG